MKRILLFLSLLLTSFVGYSQNKGINYQAVIIDPNPIEIPGKDVAAQPFVNKEVWLKFTISQDGVTQYEEIQKTQTDNYGLVNLTIGTGINTGKGGTFASLSWEGNTKNIVTSVSFDKGSRYVEVGNQKLNHVPYSLYSETANKLSGVLPISSGGTGAITSTAARANLGLDKVDNTSDLSKPVSTATLAILDTKESLSNKSTNIIADSASSVKYPSVKAIKDYIDSRNSASANSARLAAKASALETPRTINGVPFDGTANITIPVGVTPPDASVTEKGLVQLAGDLTGNAGAPTIAAGVVTTSKIADGAIIDAKIATVSGSKVTGDISGNAANVTGTITVANGGTGATTAAAARTNLGLVIGADVQAPLTAGTDYLRPNGSAANLTNFPTLNQSTTGNAATATKLAAPKNINGVPFDGSADITIAADAATLSGTVAIAKGGTGATTASDARTNLGLVIGTDVLAQRTFGTAANSAATDFVAMTEKGANNGVATLGVNGKIPSVQIPALSFQNVTVVNSDATMTAITGAQVGSIAIRTDNNNNYVLSALPASVSNNWIPLAASNDVSLINGIVGPSVNLTTNEIPEGNTNKYYTDARVRNALSAVAPLNYNASTGVLSMTAASASANGYLSAADFATFNNKQTALTAGVDYATPSGNITGNAANVTGIVSIANGGTGTSTATGALVALGAEPSDNKSNNILLDGNSTTKFPSFKAIKDYVDQQSANAGVADNSITSAKINGTLAVLKGGTGAANPADARTNLGLVIGTDVMAANFTTTLTGDVAGSGNGSFATTVNSVGGVSASAIAALPTNVAANTASITANGNSIATLNTNVAANTASITASETAIATNTTSIATNATAITSEATTARAAELTLTNSVNANTASITANTNSIAANTASITANSTDIATINTNLALKAPLASPTFTGTPTAPTPATSDNSTKVATTEYVKASITAASAGLSTIGSISATSNAKGATISGTSELILTPADITNGGVVTTGAQTFAGAKTFTNTTIFGTDIKVNGMNLGRPGMPTYTENTAVGFGVLASYAPTSWQYTYNTGVGNNALRSLTNGGNNTAVGNNALYYALTSRFNTAVGADALVNSTESNNVGIGASSGVRLTTGRDNVMVGYLSGFGMTTGSNNTIVGSQTYSQTSGAIQIGLGITTGSNNTIIGSKIFGLAPTLSNNIILADGAGNIRAQHNGTTGWTLGTIVSGTWSGTTIGSNVGGAGSVNGLMKADGSGVVSAAVAGTDYLSPSGSAALLTNFPTLNQSTTGNAATATILATARNINGVAFDGSANITIAADANTLTGTTLASNITASSLTSVGTITSGIWSATTIDIAKGGTGATTAAAALTNLGAQSVDNMSTNITTDAASITRYPSVKLIKDYVDTRVASAGVSDGSITNVKLANSTTILGSTTMTLGGSVSSVTGLTSLEATNITGTLSGTATALATGRTISTTGDVTYTSGAFDGTSNVTGSATLTNTTVTAGNYGSSTAIPTFTVDSKGRLTAASTVGITAGVSTLAYSTSGASNGGTISGTTLTLTAADASNPGLISTGAQTIAGAKTFSSDVTATNFLGNATTATTASNITATSNTTLTSLANLETVGTITSGVWSASTIDIAKGGTGATTAAGARTNLGLVIGTDVMAANYTTTLTGDVTGAGNGSFATTLAASGVNSGTYGSSTAIPTFTVDSKGRLTYAGNVGITAGVSTLAYSNTGSANGGTISGTALTLTAADASNPGLISTGAQTIAGAKTFSSDVTATNFLGNATTATTASNISATSNTTLTSLANLATVGTITAGVWSATTIDVAHGGTGLTSLTTGYISYGNGTGALGGNANLFWDNTNSRLGVGTNTPTTKLEVNGSFKAAGLSYPTSDGTSGQYLKTDGSGNIGFTSSLIVPSYSTTNRDAGTFSNGALIFNSTSGNIQASVPDNATVVTNSISNSTGVATYGQPTYSSATQQNVYVQTFTTASAVNLTSISLNTYVNSSPATVIVKVFNDSDPSNGLTNEVASVSKDISSTSDSNMETFTLPSSYLTTANATYTFVVYGISSTNIIYVGTYGSNNYSGGTYYTSQANTSYNASSNLSSIGLMNFSGTDLKFNVNYSTGASASKWIDLLNTVNLTSNVTGALPVANGGTGATTAAAARTNLGLGTLATNSSISNADVASGAAIAFSKLNITKADITGLGVQDGLTAGSGISISAGVISATGLTTANLAPMAGITNAQLANSTTTLGTTSLILGATVTSVAGLTSVTSTGFTGALTGNASTATKLAATKNINGVAFDGSADITIAADANTLTGTTLASNVVNSSLTSVGTITQGIWSGTAIAIAKGGTGATTKSAAFDALSPMTTSGDIIYGGASGTGTRLAKGTDGQVLTLASGVPSWAAISAVTTLGTFTTTSYAAGGTISGSTLTLSAADATNPGLVSTGAQTFAGAKTFTSVLTVNPASTSTLDGALMSLGGQSTSGSNKVGGVIGITAGNGGANGAGGAINLLGGSGGTNANGGDINITGGASGAALATGGSIKLTPGGFSTTTSGTVSVVGSDLFVNNWNFRVGMGRNNITTNTAVGISTLQAASLSGGSNVAFGSSALTANTTGSTNTALGFFSLFTNTTGSSNTAVGNNSLNKNESGGNNLAIGHRALEANTTGSFNVALGSMAMSQGNLTTSNNVGIGYYAMRYNNGNNNVAVGYYAGGNLGYSSTAGNNNVFLGYYAGMNAGPNTASNYNTTGSNSVMIGYDVRPAANGESNQIVISGYDGAASTVGQGPNTTTLGNSATTRAVIYGSTSLSNLPTTAASGSAGGNFTLTAQNANGTNTKGGDIILTPGTATGTGAAGLVRVTSQIEIDGGSPGAGKVLTSDAAGIASWTYGGGTTSTKTGAYTILLTDKYVFYGSTASAAATFTLPAATGNDGKEIIIKNKSAFTLTIQRSGSETIFQETSTGNNAATSITLGIESANNWVKLVSDGTQWVAFRGLF